MNRKIFYGIVFIIIFIGGVFAFIEYEKMPNAPNANKQEIAGVATSSKPAQIKKTEVIPRNEKTEQKNNIKITVSVGQNSYVVSAPAGSTVYEAIEILASTTSAFSFKDKYYSGLGYFIEEINGVKNENGKYWTLYVNGKYSTVGASQYKVLEGDRIEWVLK